MSFRLDTAITTLRTVMDILVREGQAMDPALRSRLQSVITQHAREVATVPAAIFANRLVAFLQALWDLRDTLPAAAVQALAAGQGVSQRLPDGADAGTRQELLASILRVADARWYPDAPGLAQAVSAAIARNQDRLAETEQRTWRQLEAVYHQNGDAEAYLRGIEECLGRYPAVADLMEQGKTWQRPAPAVRGLGPARVEQPPARPALENGSEVKRYANVHFPATVLLGQQLVPLIVYVSAEYRSGAAVAQDSARLALRTGDLTLVLHADGFRIAGAIGGRVVAGTLAARSVEVLNDRDCEPVVFFLQPRLSGSQRVSIDVYQADRNIASLAFETRVVDQASASQLNAVAAEPAPLASPGQVARPPDLELRVVLAADRRTLTYTLHSSANSDYNFKPVGQVTLEADPRDILRGYLQRLNQMARRPVPGRTGAESQRALRELADMGANLYAELFPRELKDEYRKLRRDYAGKSLLITSDEPWIPWELIRPAEYDDKGLAIYDDPFLCEKFQLAHWLAGRGAPEQVTVRGAAVVVPADNLAAAQEEADYFARLYRQAWDFELTSPVSRLVELETTFLAGSVQLYHFACHGNFETQDPNESKLKLVDGFLRPNQIVGARQAGLRKAQPMIFLNACHTGEIGFALTGLGGWAERFLDAGAAAFIGTLWEINDRMAARFAAEFYNRLWGLNGHKAPQSLGQAFHGARLAIKQMDPSNPTWLAYVLYGDPKASVTLSRGQKMAGA